MGIRYVSFLLRWMRVWAFANEDGKGSWLMVFQQSSSTSASSARVKTIFGSAYYGVVLFENDVC